MKLTTYGIFMKILSFLNTLETQFEKDQNSLYSFMMRELKDFVVALHEDMEKKIEDQAKIIEELQSSPNREDYALVTQQLNEIRERMRYYSPQLWNDEIHKLEAGFRIDAIKLYKARTGLGLKECKDFIEAYNPTKPPNPQ